MVVFQSIRTNKVFFISFILTVILFFLSFITEKHFIHVESPDQFTYVSSKVIFVIIMFFILQFLGNFLKQVLIKDTFYRKWFRHLIALAVPYLIIYILGWPGIIVWDEFWVYKVAADFNLDDWQSYLTVYYYLINLYIFPSLATIVFSQFAFLAFVSSWIITKMDISFPLNKLKYLLFVLLIFSPAIVFSTLTTYRSTMVAMLELLLIGLLYFSSLDKNISNRALVLIVLCTILLSTWRKEGIYHIVLVPIAIAFTFKDLPRLSLYKIIVSSIIGVLLINSFIDSRKDEYTKMKYEVTAYINPLSNILSDKNVKVSPDALNAFDKILDVEKIKQMAYHYEIPAFWNGATRDNFTKDDFHDFKVQYIKLVKENLDIFLAARTRTMLAASGFSHLGHTVRDSIGGYIEKKHEYPEHVNETMSNSLNHPFNNDLRSELIKILNWSTSHEGLVSKAMLFWNFTPILLLLSIIVVRVQSLRSPVFWAAILCVTRVPLLFITEPGSYFMYYYPLFLPGIFVIALYVLEKFNYRY